MITKASELSGAALDWAVAKAEGWDGADLAPYLFTSRRVKYSTDWAQGGPIIEREWIELTNNGNAWQAIGRGFGEDAPEGSGPTPLIAAMRCYVASKLGDTVDVPDALGAA